METPKPKLIITESDGDNPMKAMCSSCRAILPALDGKGPEANRRLIETCFQDHVKAEHSDQPPPWEIEQGE